MDKRSEDLNNLLNRLRELNKLLASQIVLAHQELQMRKSRLIQQQPDNPVATFRSKADVSIVALMWQEHLN
ncbi:hypothetical protein [Cesiribacter sp. SM1]|uniref:hypothetical protein n=1 Tax=Cesiribacter sp. SM1 TaxID=2861196 RepID=UPI001CD3CE8A|nr:hypothetical protein [Cesiribacter sp. SM1]